MTRRVVLTSEGPTRLALLKGVPRRGPETQLVVGESEIPVVVNAPHLLLAEGPVLLADPGGTPLVREGDQVELTGGFSPVDNVFHASRVAIVETG